VHVILFDIDGTLMRGHGSGSRALLRAGRAVCGEAFNLEGITISGGLDMAIYESAARAMGMMDPEALHEAFRARYLLELASELASSSPRAELLPGVLPLLAALDARTDVAVGLLTGNYRAAVPIKFKAVGLDYVFAAGAYGDDARLRHGLVPIALERFAQLGRRAAAAQVVVVGDTPRDVECAVKNGCRCLGVATGMYGEAALHDAGAHRVVPDLRDPDALLSLL
jgi:phosphoglycolate phosphatase